MMSIEHPLNVLTGPVNTHAFRDHIPEYRHALRQLFKRANDYRLGAEWKSLESEGARLYRARPEGSQYDAVRGLLGVKTDASPQDFLKFMNDALFIARYQQEYMHELDPQILYYVPLLEFDRERTDDGVQILEPVSHLVHYKVETRQRLISNRDFVEVRRTERVDDPIRIKDAWVSYGGEFPGCNDVDGIYPRDKGCERATVKFFMWHVSRIEQGLRIEFISHSEPGGSLPAALFNVGSREKALAVIRYFKAFETVRHERRQASRCLEPEDEDDDDPKRAAEPGRSSPKEVLKPKVTTTTLHSSLFQKLETDASQMSPSQPNLQRLPKDSSELQDDVVLSPSHVVVEVSKHPSSALQLPPSAFSSERTTIEGGDDVSVTHPSATSAGSNLGVGVVVQRLLDEDALERFRAGIGERADIHSNNAVAIAELFVISIGPLICILVGSLVTLILSSCIPTPVHSVASLKPALIVCCAIVFVILLCLVLCCCLFVAGVALEVTRDGEPTCRTMCPGFIGFCLCLLFVLCGLPVVVLSGVIGSTSVGGSSIPWGVFVLSLVALLFPLLGICAFCVLGARAACPCLKRLMASLKDVCVCVKCCHNGIVSCLEKILARVRVRRKPCWRSLAERFVYEDLEIHHEWFETVSCYCQRCWVLGSFPASRTQGGKKYAVPRYWTRFGLPPSRGAKVRGLDQWHVAYHGTSGLSAKAIIESQRMLMPGDRRPDGGHIEIRPGHISDESFARNVFMSPSVFYTSSPVYCIPREIEDEEGKKYQVLVALELVIQPETYDVGPETIGSSVPIDPIFSNEELEWFTDRRGVIEVNGLLVKVEELPSGSSLSPEEEEIVKNMVTCESTEVSFSLGNVEDGKRKCTKNFKLCSIQWNAEMSISDTNCGLSLSWESLGAFVVVASLRIQGGGKFGGKFDCTQTITQGGDSPAAWYGWQHSDSFVHSGENGYVIPMTLEMTVVEIMSEQKFMRQKRLKECESQVLQEHLKNRRSGLRVETIEFELNVEGSSQQEFVAFGTTWSINHQKYCERHTILIACKSIVGPSGVRAKWTLTVPGTDFAINVFERDYGQWGMDELQFPEEALRENGSIVTCPFRLTLEIIDCLTLSEEHIESDQIVDAWRAGGKISDEITITFPTKKDPKNPSLSAIFMVCDVLPYSLICYPDGKVERMGRADDVAFLLIPLKLERYQIDATYVIETWSELEEKKVIGKSTQDGKKESPMILFPRFVSLNSDQDWVVDLKVNIHGIASITSDEE